jgi:hypothetical protein
MGANALSPADNNLKKEKIKSCLVMWPCLVDPLPLANALFSCKTLSVPVGSLRCTPVPAHSSHHRRSRRPAATGRSSRPSLPPKPYAGTRRDLLLGNLPRRVGFVLHRQVISPNLTLPELLPRASRSIPCRRRSAPNLSPPPALFCLLPAPTRGRIGANCLSRAHVSRYTCRRPGDALLLLQSESPATRAAAAATAVLEP